MDSEMLHRNYEQEVLKLRERMEEMEAQQQQDIPQLESERAVDVNKYNELFEELREDVTKKIEDNFTVLKREVQVLKNGHQDNVLSNLNNLHKQIASKVAEVERAIEKAGTSNSISEDMDVLLGDIVFVQSKMGGMLIDIKQLLTNIDKSIKQKEKDMGQNISELETQLKTNMNINIDHLKEGVIAMMEFLLFLDGNMKSINNNVTNMENSLTNNLRDEIGSVREGLTEIIKFLISLSEKGSF